MNDDDAVTHDVEFVSPSSFRTGGGAPFFELLAAPSQIWYSVALRPNLRTKKKPLLSCSCVRCETLLYAVSCKKLSYVL